MRERRGWIHAIALRPQLTDLALGASFFLGCQLGIMAMENGRCIDIESRGGVSLVIQIFLFLACVSLITVGINWLAMHRGREGPKACFSSRTIYIHNR